MVGFPLGTLLEIRTRAWNNYQRHCPWRTTQAQIAATNQSQGRVSNRSREPGKETEKCNRKSPEQGGKGKYVAEPPIRSSLAMMDLVTFGCYPEYTRNRAGRISSACPPGSCR